MSVSSFTPRPHTVLDDTDKAHASWTPSPGGGRKPIRMALSSTLDTILLGRDFDMSGDDPHKAFMEKYGSHAGVPSGSKQVRPFRKPGVSLNSTMDTIIYGRDFDCSGDDPYESHMARFDKSHAGKISGNLTQRPFRKPGVAQQSVMDTVIYGRDFDGSGDSPHVDYMQKFSDHAGVKSICTDTKPLRRIPRILNSEFKSSMKTVFHEGEAVDYVPVNQFEAWMDVVTEGAAGVRIRSPHKAPRPFFKRSAVRLKSTVENVVFNKDYQDHEDILDFTEYAGKRSGIMIQRGGGSKSCPSLKPADTLTQPSTEVFDPPPRTVAGSANLSTSPEEDASQQAEDVIKDSNLDDESNSVRKNSLGSQRYDSDIRNMEAASIIPERINPFGAARSSRSSAASTCSRSSLASSATGQPPRWR